MTPLPPSPFLSAAGQSPRRSAAAEPATELRTHPAAPVAGPFDRLLRQIDSEMEFLVRRMLRGRIA
jgi:hypothetical protein